jgi:hypothetical protein
MAKLTMKWELTEEEIKLGVYNSVELSIDNIDVGSGVYTMLEHYEAFLKVLTYTVPTKDDDN